ncbi:MAG: hypothetical protein KGN01_07170 [Patescibacteria group bacterium]|nr:hypothetical protein [Patescibacteria group bacterium]
MAQLKKSFGGHIGFENNVEYKLTDKNGNAKKMFSDNKLNVAILKFIRSFVKEPIDENGQVKEGLMNKIAAYGIRIPFITGQWSFTKFATNGITNAGRADISGLLNGNGSISVFSSIGQGTGTTAFAATQTALVSGVTAGGTADAGVHALASASVTKTRVTTTVTNDTAQWQGTVNETATIAITESGVFNADTNGDMLCRQTFSAINVVNGDSLQFTWKVQNS